MRLSTPVNLFALVAISMGTSVPICLAAEASRPNVLFIIVDDLRPELGSYGDHYIHSPNMDRLADESVVFSRAYCSVPVCGASRASMMTGLHPTETRFRRYNARIDSDSPEAVSLTKRFKQAGYHTVSVGKVFHSPDDDLESWSKRPWRPDYPNDLGTQVYWRDYQSPENDWTGKVDQPGGAPGPAWEAAEVDDEAYADGKIAARAVKELKSLADRDEPFFLAVGFIKPHLPFNAPKRYWDLYERGDVDLAANPFFPKGAPQEAWFRSGELRSYTSIGPEEEIGFEDSLTLKRGYAACVSYIDALVGRVLDQLEALDLRDDTIVALCGDHGWNLGEHDIWGKQTSFENSLRTPLMISVPGREGGITTDALVSFVDIYPTLCDLAGVEVPSEVDGSSLLPVLRSPEQEIHDHVFSRFGNAETITSQKFGYTRFYKPNESGELPEMLYDHTVDPRENVNVVDLPEYREATARFVETLEEHRASR